MRRIIIPILVLTALGFSPSQQKKIEPDDDCAIMVKRIDQQPPIIIKYVWAGEMGHEDFC